jgi:hypothetical protein
MRRRGHPLENWSVCSLSDLVTRLQTGAVAAIANETPGLTSGAGQHQLDRHAADVTGAGQLHDAVCYVERRTQVGALLARPIADGSAACATTRLPWSTAPFPCTGQGALEAPPLPLMSDCVPIGSLLGRPARSIQCQGACMIVQARTPSRIERR